MNIIDLKDIQRTDSPIYYRRFYSGILLIEIMAKVVERKIDFKIEMMPTGKKDISITFEQPVDYPLVPLMRELKKYLEELDRSGGLPV
ncbi:MAG: hypothetical protein LBV20_05265 [Treponema sp.]|jgi:hypothetical protein|nr:hypothetical protein [Treponema sp.]